MPRKKKNSEDMLEEIVKDEKLIDQDDQDQTEGRDINTRDFDDDDEDDFSSQEVEGLMDKEEDDRKEESDEELLI